MLVIGIVGERNGVSVLIGLLDQTSGTIVDKAQSIAVVCHNLRQTSAFIRGLHAMAVAVKNLLKVATLIEHNAGAVLLMKLENATGFSKGGSALTDQFIAAVRLPFKVLLCSSNVNNHAAI